jgi:hypothetical protein
MNSWSGTIALPTSREDHEQFSCRSATLETKAEMEQFRRDFGRTKGGAPPAGGWSSPHALTVSWQRRHATRMLTQKIQRAVLTVDLPNVPTTKGVIGEGDVNAMHLEVAEGVTFLKIIAKGEAAIWLVPMDKVICMEPKV